MAVYESGAEQSSTISVVITRADGTVEDLGVIAASFSDHAKQAAWEADGLKAADRRIRVANRRARWARWRKRINQVKGAP